MNGCQHKFMPLDYQCLECGEVVAESPFLADRDRDFYAALRRLAKLDLPPAARAIVEEALR